MKEAPKAGRQKRLLEATSGLGLHRSLRPLLFSDARQAMLAARPTGPEVPTMIDPQELAELKRDPARVSPCIWECSSDPDVSFWNTSCGEAWTFITGGPKENGMKFCPYCGGRLIITE
jgi:hypothetical protein